MLCNRVKSQCSARCLFWLEKGYLFSVTHVLVKLYTSNHKRKVVIIFPLGNVSLKWSNLVAEIDVHMQSKLSKQQ